MRYFDVYVLCQTADNLLSGGFERNLADFFEPLFGVDGITNKFSKYSLLHDFCEWVIRQNVWDEEENIVEVIRETYRRRKSYSSEPPLWIDRAINFYCKPAEKNDFLRWVKAESAKAIDELTDCEIDDFRYDYLQELQLGSEDFDSCVDQLTMEMFYILFQNREFLYNFNSGLSAYNPNKNKRIAIPKWAQRAVFFRDHGCCVFCGKDLSGTIHATEDREIHYDHIISLDNNGVNDVSNLQLCCKECNLGKSNSSDTSANYRQWYDTKDMFE
jgi:hypothetical protein